MRNSRWWNMLTGTCMALVMAAAADIHAQGPSLLVRTSNIGYQSTNSIPEGLAVFNQSVFVPFGVNTLTITVSGTTDGHNGAATLLKCTYQSSLCDPFTSYFINPGGPGPGTSYPGWVAVHKLPNVVSLGGVDLGDDGGGGSDIHSNSFYKTWCIALSTSSSGFLANFQISLATSGPDSFSGALDLPAPVFIQSGVVKIEAAKLTGGGGCTVI